MVDQSKVDALEERIEEFGDAVIPDVVERLAIIAREQVQNWPKDMDEYLDGEDYHFAKGCRYACGIVAEVIREREAQHTTNLHT